MGQVLSTGLGIKASKRNPTKWKRWHVLESLCKKFKWTKDSAQGDSAKPTGDSGTDDQSAVAVEEKPENSSADK